MTDYVSEVAANLLNGNSQRFPDRRVNLFVARSFYDAEACRALIALIERDNRPSTIADDLGTDRFRTSKTCDLPIGATETRRLDGAISAFLGISPELGEPLQGQKYEVGDEFRDHTDYFEPDGSDYFKYCSETGQRTWTAMLYLNAPDSGGATRFRRLEKTLRPEVGKLVVWANLTREGLPNPLTLHSGLKVRSGVKYVVTKWYRERRWSQEPCG